MFEHPYAHQILLDDRTAAQSLVGNPGPTPLLNHRDRCSVYQPPQQYMQHQQQVHQDISSTQPTRRSSFGGVRGILNLNGSMSGSSQSTPPNSGMRDDSRAGGMGVTAAETTTPLEHFAKAQLAQEKLTRKLVAKIATLQETPWLSLTNVAVGLKNFEFCPVKDAVVWLAHRLSYAELMLIGMMIYTSSPYLKPHVSQFLKQLRSSLLQNGFAGRRWHAGWLWVQRLHHWPPGWVTKRYPSWRLATKVQLTV